MLFTCSVDKTGAVWDVEVGERIKKLKGHTSFVNSCCPTRRGVALLATGSDDGTIKVITEAKDTFLTQLSASMVLIFMLVVFHRNTCIYMKLNFSFELNDIHIPSTPRQPLPLSLSLFLSRKVWDVRKKGAVQTLNSTFQVSVRYIIKK